VQCGPSDSGPAFSGSDARSFIFWSCIFSRRVQILHLCDPVTPSVGVILCCWSVLLLLLRCLA